MSQQENRMLQESEGRVLCVEVNGGVSSKLYNDMYLPAWRKTVDEYGEVRLLFYYPSPETFPGWEEETARQDLKHFTDNGHELTRVALVNAPDKVCQRWDFLTPLLGGPVKEFDKNEFSAALEWIKG